MFEREPDYFDVPGVEGDDLEQDSVAEGEAADVEAEAVAEVAAELASEPEPTPSPVPPPSNAPPEPMIPLDMHVKSAAAGGQYPTEDPGDGTTIWSPSPGVIGSNQQGFRKI